MVSFGQLLEQLTQQLANVQYTSTAEERPGTRGQVASSTAAAQGGIGPPQLQHNNRQSRGRLNTADLRVYDKGGHGPHGYIVGHGPQTNLHHKMSSQNRSKMGKTFVKMTSSCPQQIVGYGTCLQAQAAAGLERGACEEEFAALKRCFQKAAKGVKASR